MGPSPCLEGRRMRMRRDKLGSYRPHFPEMGCRFGKGLWERGALLTKGTDPSSGLWAGIQGRLPDTMRLGWDLAQNLVPDGPPAGPGSCQCSVDFNGERQSWSDSREDNSPPNPEGKSKGDCQHRERLGSRNLADKSYRKGLRGKERGSGRDKGGMKRWGREERQQVLRARMEPGS